MAKRGMNAAIEAISEAQVSTYYETVEIVLSASTYRLTNAPHTVVYESNTYNPFGTLLGFADVEENATLEIPQLAIQISGIDIHETGESPVADFLAEDYTHAPVKISRVYYNDDGFVGGFELFRGYVASATIAFDNRGESAVNIQCSSHWSDFARETGRMTNTASQQDYFTTDLGFDYSQEVQKEITWKPSPQS